MTQHQNLVFVLAKLEKHLNIAMKWFENNYMKMNSDKCDLSASGKKSEHFWVKTDNNRIWESRTLTLLGISLDNELQFDEYLYNVCLKANRKLSASSKIKKYLDFDKTRTLFKGFFESQFKYFLLTWMFNRRSTNI